jgi:hypothetical protein
LLPRPIAEAKGGACEACLSGQRIRDYVRIGWRLAEGPSTQVEDLSTLDYIIFSVLFFLIGLRERLISVVGLEELRHPFSSP